MKNLPTIPQLAVKRAPRVTPLSVTLAFLLSVFLLLGMALFQMGPAYAAGGLTIEVLAAYNLVVDSNSTSPSTYAPSVATVAGKFCNTGAVSLTNVQGFIGNYVDGTNDTPGVYPARDSSQLTFTAQHPVLANSGDYAFTHVGGRVGMADATRYIGTLAPGQCKVQYWHFVYPQCRNVNISGNWVRENPPCSGTPTWGDSVKPGDDLWLEFDVWAKDGSGAAYDNKTWRMTMRNEISAMANKIKPNPDGQWFNTKESQVLPGDVITSNGVLYEFGRINQGFDNNGDFVPDYNAWAQPIGDQSYDPGCFRLIRTTGVLTVTRGGGNPNMLIPFTDQLYFTNLPSDNTGVRGEVHYTFQALNGPCSIPLTPYQEVASGYDNEKFNGDYGTGIPPVGSLSPEVNIDKTGNAMVAKPGTITYNIPFQNNSSTTPAGLTLSSGWGVNMPVVLSDTVPNGLQYVGSSASASLSYTPNNGVTRRFSTDSGKTWSSTDPGTVASTAPNSLVIIQWWLNDPLPASSTGSYATYQATVPGTYSSPIVENCATGSFGGGVPFDRACAITLVQGTGSIGDRVWRDENGDGNQAGEIGISGIKVDLYWDRNGDGELDSGDVLISTQDTSGTGTSNYDFTQLPAANYLVKVDANDADLPTGYSLTTVGMYAVPLAAGQDYNDADFGFGPTLRVDKHLETLDPAVVGEIVTFHIDLVNTRPGDGTANGYCVYDVWPAATSTDSNANKQFANLANAVGAPNLTYSTADFQTGAGQWIAGSTFSSGGHTSSITKVEAVVNFYVLRQLVDDELQVSMSGGASAWSHNFLPATINLYAPGEGKKGNMIVEVPGTYAPGGSWDWADLNTALQLRLDMVKRASPERTNAVMNLDAFGFRVTTSDTSCATGDSTINPLPLTDTYDPTYLQFISADPMPSNSSTPGTLTWDNLGPLYAGGTKTVVLNFKALATVASTTNTASVTGAKFSSGRSVNDANDTATVGIDTSSSLSGKTWIDSGGTIGWVSGQGHDTPFPGTDKALPDVKVDLYVCRDPATGLPIPSSSDNKTCTGSGYVWALVATAYTDNLGDFSFTGLRPGYYNVRINGLSLPTGMTSQTAEATGGAGGAGGAGGNNEWNDQATVLRDLAFLNAGTPITQVNFGYRNASSGTVTGYVWQDQDKDNTWDANELPIPGTTVTLYCTGTGCAQPSYSTTTDPRGYYQFSNLPTTNATYQVVITPPSGMSQSGDPEGGACYGGAGCDNQTNTFTLAPGGARGPDLFGYTGGLNIGDTIYVDWNGDGTQGSGEEGISGVKVDLVRDSNGNGTYDPGTDAHVSTATTMNYRVIDGAIDVSGNGTIGSEDDGVLQGVTVIDGQLDISGNGSIGSEDDGAFVGYTVIDGWLDMNNSGTITADDDGDLLGKYQFTNLPGNGSKYFVVVNPSTLPAGYTQTGDPDGTKDNKTTITLNSAHDWTADFGYQPRGFGSIGDFVWKDTDGDGIQDAGEPGISGVTVKLYQDQDGDGVKDPEDALVDTTTTNGSGIYTFSNLSAGNYIVQVDSSNFGSGQPLNGLTMSTSGTPYNVSQVSYQVALGNAQHFVDADFGFTSSAIGDTVWQDNNGDGLQDTGEPGIANVGVELWQDTNNDGTGDTLVATQNTDTNGHYYFTGLPAGDYVVVIPASNFNSGQPLYNFVQTYDPDAATVPCSGGQCDNMGKLVDPTAGYGLPLGQVDYSRDFGYQPRGVIGDTLWINSDGDSVRDPGESGIANVTVYLYANGTCAGAPATSTATDLDGYYSFGNLADGSYCVRADRTDPDFPAGLVQNYDPDGTLDDKGSNVVMSGGVVTSIGGNACSNCDLNVDLGYRYNGTYSISGHVFFDQGNDGGYYTPASGDMPYQGIRVYLWNSSGQLIGSVPTDANGFYQFPSLPNGTYTVSMNPSEPKLEGTAMTVEPDVLPTPGVCGTCNNRTTVIISNANVTDRDFGFWKEVPTAVELASFTATVQGDAILLTWQTASEMDVLGFNLYRAESADGPLTRLNADLIRGQYSGTPRGAVYTSLDEMVTAGTIYYYWLEGLDASSATTWSGPVAVQVPVAPLETSYRVFLPLVGK